MASTFGTFNILTNPQLLANLGLSIFEFSPVALSNWSFLCSLMVSSEFLSYLENVCLFRYFNTIVPYFLFVPFSCVFLPPIWCLSPSHFSSFILTALPLYYCELSGRYSFISTFIRLYLFFKAGC